MAIRNFLVALKLFLNAKSSLSNRSLLPSLTLYWNWNNCGSLLVWFIIVVHNVPPTLGVYFHRPCFVTKRWYLRSLKILMRLDPHNDGMFICFGIFSMCFMSCSRKIDVFWGLRYIIQPEGKVAEVWMCPSYAGTVIKQAFKSRLVNKQSNNSLRLLNSKAENV